MSTDNDNTKIAQIKDGSGFPGEHDFLPEGSGLGRYRELHLVGYGGSSSVYKAFDPEMERQIALKILHGRELHMKDARERFRREIKAQGRLSIPGVIRIHDCGEADGRFYYTMELVEGATIDKHAESKSLDTVSRISLAARLAGIITALHRMNLVHRDLKPANVMVDIHGEIKLLDFGLAKSVEAGNAELNGLTQAGEILGTPWYMPPEQLDGVNTKDNPKAADIYSLGILVYELLTGKLPFEIEHLQLFELAYVVNTKEPEGLKKYNPMVPERAEKIIMRALCKNPAERPSAEEFARELEVSYHPLAKSSPSFPRKLQVAAGLACIVSLAAFGSWSYLHNQKTKPSEKHMKPGTSKPFHLFPVTTHPATPDKTQEEKTDNPQTATSPSPSDPAKKTDVPAVAEDTRTEKSPEKPSVKQTLRQPDWFKVSKNDDSKFMYAKGESEKVDSEETAIKEAKKEASTILSDRLAASLSSEKDIAEMLREYKFPGIDVLEQKTQHRDDGWHAWVLVKYPQQDKKVLIERIKKGSENLRYVESIANGIKDDFDLHIASDNGKSGFYAGEKIQFRVTSEKNCYIAMFLHQSDGNTILMYPNKWSQDPWLPAGAKLTVPVPERDKFNFEISPPYGDDVVQVVACTSKCALQKRIDKEINNIPESQNLAVIERGIIIKEVKTPPEQPKEPNTPALWGECHFIVPTFSQSHAK